MALKKLIYSSRRIDAGADDLDAILAASQRNNRADGITGVLLHDRKRFIQFLEGDHDAIARCFLRIALSPDHTDIQIGALDDSAIRVFMGWDMQGIGATRTRPSLTTLWRRLMAAPQGDRLSQFESALLDMLPPR